MFKAILNKLINGEALSRIEAEQAMQAILSSQASSAQIASFISIMSFRELVFEELLGLTQAMRGYAERIEQLEDLDAVDTCGTGASKLKTFNISTASALLTAAAGQPVAKHGNRAVTSHTGSADVLQALGIETQLGPKAIRDALESFNMCFMFAPLYHEAMKHAAITRREIGFRSVFNLLGPLTNPAGVKRQVIGVFSERYAEIMLQVLQATGAVHVLIVHGEDGLDEFTLGGSTTIYELKHGEIITYSLSPADVGLQQANMHALRVKDATESAELITRIVKGDVRGPARDIVLFNAGAALYVGGRVESIRDGVLLAQQTIDSGQAATQLERMQCAYDKQQEEKVIKNA